MSRLQEYYKETVIPQLMEKLGFSNPMEVPRIEKITLNMGVGETMTVTVFRSVAR
jgi:large subunit ribosomal protein L5